MNKSILLKITIAFIAIVFSFKANAQSPTLAWAKQMQDSAASVQIGYGYAVALDANENVYTTGHFVGTHDFDPGVGVYKLSALVGGSSVFVSKLDSTGAFVWAKKIGGNGSSGRSIAIGNSGDVYITGHFSGISDMDPGPGVFNLSSIGFEDIFVMKLNSLGNFVWAKRIGDSGTDIGHSITIDASENLFITGSYAGSPDFDPGAGTTIMASNGSVDAFILKLDGSGNFVFSKNLGGTGNEFGYSVTLDGTGNIYTTGSFNSTSDFDPSAGTFNMTPSAFGGTDAFISKLNSLGNFVWAKKFGGSSTSFAYGIKIDNSGDVIIAGHFTGTVDFDPNAGTFNITSASSGASSSIFVSKLNASGNLVWAKGFGGSASCYALSVDIAGGIYTTGFFGTFSDFDPGVPTYYLNNINGRVFISKLDLNGNFSWANNIAGSTNAEGRGIIVDAIGNVFSTGTFENTGDFDPGAGSFTMSTSITNNLNIYIQRLKGGACLAPSQPISISGSVSICSGSSNTYSVSAVAGATSYTWTLPGGWTGTSTTNSITATASATSGNITVTANNACGNSSAQTLSVTVNTIPATPTLISGTTTICSGSSNTYSVSTVAGATSYTWTLPGGWSGTSTTNSISTTASATSGNITVTANNVCGNSTAATLAIVVNTIPPTPGTISGLASMCIGTGAQTYSITAVGGATSYTWTLPATWSGASTTNSIVATPGTSGGSISVTANNTCGNSSPQTLAVIINPLPTVTYSQSPALVCVNATSVALGTTSPTGGTFTGTGVTGSTFNASTAGTGTFNITYTYTDGNGCVNFAISTIVVDPCTGISQNTIDNEIVIYPNPTTSAITLSGIEGIATIIEVYNVLGKIVLSQQITNDKTEIDLSKETNGIYFIKISSDTGTSTKRIIKQ